MLRDAERRRGDGFDPRRVEEAGLNTMQTQRQLFYDGWLLRLSPGSAKRGRSVNPHFGSRLPLEAKIDHCEAVYARHRLPVLFRITPFMQPPELEAALAARGYVEFDDTLVQTLPLGRLPALPKTADGPAPELTDVHVFVDAVAALRESTDRQREALRERLAQSALDKRFAVVRAGGRVVCTAQVAIEERLVGVFDVVTAAEERGRGHATRICGVLLAAAREGGAKLAYLQVSAGNAPALGVYGKLGFATAYRYHYRGRPGACE